MLNVQLGGIVTNTSYCWRAPRARSPLGRVQVPKGPKIEKIQSRLKFSISLEIFNLDLKFSISTFRIPTKISALVGGSLEIFESRLKISIPEGDLEFFQSLGP